MTEKKPEVPKSYFEEAKTLTGLTLKEAAEVLAVDFPQSAIKARVGSGGDLSSINTYYEIERLNNVFGLCGTGWWYEIASMIEHGDTLVAEVHLHYAFFCHADNVRDKTFSAPIPSKGQGVVRKGMSRGDAEKSAITDALTKAASMLGVGLSVFKGEQSHKDKGPTKRKPGMIDPDWEAKQRAAKDPKGWDKIRKETQAKADREAVRMGKPVKLPRDPKDYELQDGTHIVMPEQPSDVLKESIEPSNPAGIRPNPAYAGKESEKVVTLPATFKTAPKSGKSLIYTIFGKDVVLPIKHVVGHSDTEVCMTHWIANKKHINEELPSEAIEIFLAGGHGDAWEAPPPDDTDVDY